MHQLNAPSFLKSSLLLLRKELDAVSNNYKSAISEDRPKVPL